MEQKSSSFSLFLNVILALLLIGSIAFGYFFGNFGGISIQELKENYIFKDELKFSDLPAVIKEDYIKKDTIALKPKSSKGLEKVFDEFGNPIDIVEGDVDDLQTMVKSLQERVVYLEQENMLLSNDKNELLKIVQSEKSTREIEESSLLSKNLEKINEAEKQHYKNISELTLKINDLQRENISLSNALNKEKELYKEQIEGLEKKIVDEKEKAKLTQNDALKEQVQKYEILERTNKANEDKVLELGKLLQSLREDEIINSAKKDKQIVGLQNKINELIIEKNTLLTQNSKSVLELEKQSSQKLQKVEETIREYQKEKQELQASYERLDQENREKFNKLLGGLKKENEELKSELAKVTQNSILILKNSETSLNSKELEYKKLLLQASDEFKTALAKEKEENLKLTKELSTLQTNFQNANKELELQHSKVQSQEDKILQLNDKIVSLSTQNRSVDKEVEEQVNENEKKHNENYRYLNEKVASLQKSLRDLTATQLEKQNGLEVQTKLKIAEFEKKYTLLNAEFMKNKKELENLQESKGKLLAQVAELQKDKKSLEQSEHAKLIEIRDSFKELQTQFKQKEDEYKIQLASVEDKTKHISALEMQQEKDKEKLGNYLREITALKKTLKDFEGQIVKSDTVPISDQKRKLALLGQVECDDMNSGNFKVSATCKEKVSKFLDNYSESHYYEVIPIVGTGGFGSLNKIKNDKKAGIPESEIDRLTELANLGLGKHRAKEGGWLIREKFGDYAKISYTVYNIEAEGKRGFVIRAYR